MSVLASRIDGQQLIANQSFELSAADTWAYTTSPSSYNTENDSVVNGDEAVWDRIVSFYGDIDQAFSGNWFWGMQDLNNSSGGGNFAHTLIFDPFNTTGYEDLMVRLAINCREWDTGDQLSMILCLDGVPQDEMILFAGQGDSSTADWEYIEVPIIGNIGSVALEIKATQNGSSDYGGIDAVSLVGIESAPCALEITSADLICEDLTQVGLDLHFTIQEKGPSGQYYISAGNDTYGPYDYVAGINQYRYVPISTSQPGILGLRVYDADAPPAHSLRINEVLYDVPAGASGDANQDGVTNSSQDEYVELINFSGLSVDISGWTLWDNGGSQPRHIFPEGTILEHREAIVVFGGGSPPSQMNNSPVQVASSGSLSLNNVSSGGDQISLYEDAAGTSLHTNCDWTSGFSDANESINLDPDISGATYSYHSDISTGGLLYSPGIGSDGSEWDWPLSCVDGTFIDIPDCCQSHTYFRTVQSGSWEDVMTWEVSMDGIGDWKSACTFPGTSPDHNVQISSGAQIVLSDSAIVGYLRIQTGATLSIEQAALVLHDGYSGPDLLVEGELHDHSNSQNGIKFTGNSTWELAPGATIVKTGNSTGTGFRDQYHGGIDQIPSSSNWIYRYEGGGTTPSVISVGMVYPNLFFENNAGGLYEPGIGNGYFQGGSGSIRIKGDLMVGGSTGGAYTVRNCNFASEPLTVEGDLILGPGSILTNKKPPCCPNLVSIKEGTGFQFEGDIQVAENALLELRKQDGGDSNENSQERVCWIAGSSAQQINGMGTIDIDHLGMMTSGSCLMVHRNLSVRERLELIEGKIDMTGYSFTVLNDLSAAVSGHAPGESESTSYIFNGTLERRVQSSGSFDFPLGDPLNYQLLTLDLSSSNVDLISAAFISSAGGYQPIVEGGYGYSDLLNNGHWSVGPSADQPGFEGIYSITLYGQGYDNPGSPCAALKTEEGTWQNNPSGISSPADCTINPGSVKAIRNNATTFSKHGIGVNGILPLGKLTLDASLAGSQEVIITGVWQGDIEHEGMYFKLFRRNGFAEDELVYASNLNMDLSVNKIEFHDGPLAPGFILYKLDLVNGSGEVIESTMESILITERSDCAFYPNPAKDKIYMSCSKGELNMIHAYNTAGKRYSLKTVDGNTFDISHLNPGVYWIYFHKEILRLLKM